MPYLSARRISSNGVCFSIFMCTVLQRGTCVVDCFKLFTKKQFICMGFPRMVTCKEAETLWVLYFFFNIFKSTLRINYFGIEVVILEAFTLEIPRKSGYVTPSFVGRLTGDFRQVPWAFKKRTGEYSASFLWLGHAGFCFQGSETQLTSVTIPAAPCVS